ncbi:uncharacterized protein BCR38DRAFT_234031 [Pseudomassariella vexata]|uniref:Uncharacterized protein n=1 Tax=Pseudomassariella vexata TaxID=1141098 RepID=A0A1Y2DSC6_9PEZI|nr:uncharacterized protein BCR38DRAFT_234031 [Pseudomassariella vexata]ORY62173.1 hypothetical protein BCR38DRAFT_234031 [Pseudomassariella vexata]
MNKSSKCGTGEELPHPSTTSAMRKHGGRSGHTSLPAFLAEQNLASLAQNLGKPVACAQLASTRPWRVVVVSSHASQIVKEDGRVGFSFLKRPQFLHYKNEKFHVLVMQSRGSCPDRLLNFVVHCKAPLLAGQGWAGMSLWGHCGTTSQVVEDELGRG